MYILSLLFSIQNFEDTLASPTGQPVLQIFVDVFGREGGTAAMSIIIACVTLCGTCSMTSNSRMYYAFSRVSPRCLRSACVLFGGSPAVDESGPKVDAV